MYYCKINAVITTLVVLIILCAQECFSDDRPIKCWNDIVHYPKNASVMSPNAETIICEAPDNVCLKMIFTLLDGRILKIKRSCEDMNDQRLPNGICGTKGLTWSYGEEDIKYYIDGCHCDDRNHCNSSQVIIGSYALIAIAIVLWILQ